MKTFFIIALSLFSVSTFSVHAQHSGISKKEAKKIATDINASLDQLNTSLDSVDWKALGDLLNKAIVAVDQHADALTEIAKNIDMDKVNANLDKVAAHIEKSVDTKQLEKQLEELGVKIEKSIEKSNK
ncbi:hypothetical protein EMGBS15_18170 [Filimonas sp.]|jgi:hypothetical protein|nr:hypothetical protein EMGBS15_18170 [Filimonas sp.]